MALVASLVATAVSGVFTVRLASRWVAGGRRNPALLAWTISLAMFAIASLMLLAGTIVGWSVATFHVFYLFGAVLTVPWLALGSVLVNTRDRLVSRLTGGATLLVGLAFLPGALRGEPLAVPGAVLGLVWALMQLDGDRDRLRVGSALLLVAFTIVAAVVVLTATFTAPLPSAGLPEGRELFPEAARGFAVGGNAIGSIVVIVGAVMAAFRLMWLSAGEDVRAVARSHVRARRLVDAAAAGVLGGWRALEGAGFRALVTGNLFIALGVVIAAGSGGMFSFLGDTEAHAIGLGLGVLVMYGGFERTTRPVVRA